MNSNEQKESMKNAFLSKKLFYPNERVIAFLAKYYSNIKDNFLLNALDIGCGNGRHLNLLLDYNLNTYGIDFLKDAVDNSSEIIFNRTSNTDRVFCGDYYNKYDNETFDIIICLGSIFYHEVDIIQRDLIDINRIMKPGGRLFIDFRTNEDSMNGKGKKINEYSFILDERTNEYCSILYTFLSQEVSSDLLIAAGFSIDYIERSDFWKNNLKDRHSWWYYSVKK